MEREMDKYKCTTYIRKHSSLAKKLLINITECKVLNYTTDKNNCRQANKLIRPIHGPLSSMGGATIRPGGGTLPPPHFQTQGVQGGIIWE